MCGIVGIVDHRPVNLKLYDALTILQHRGQDAAGIATADRSAIHLQKNNGLVKDVFEDNQLSQLAGATGIGHVRYPTAGCDSPREAQPFYRLGQFAMALAHNGTITNTQTLLDELNQSKHYRTATHSDSEILLQVFAQELDDRCHGTATPEAVFGAVRAVHKRCSGAYAAIVLIAGFGIVAFRDPFGIRPLVFGTSNDGGDPSYMVASESVALNVLGYDLTRDVQPGEAVVIETNGTLTANQCADSPRSCPCLFELVYLARPDSIMDEVSVYKARLRMGDKLASKILRDRPDHDIDVVIPIPDTSRSSAIQVAHHLGVKYREGFIKNRYIGRTFIMPGQAMRKKSVRRKLNAIDLEFQDKTVLLVDDSIVRGTTCGQIIQMARDAGAKKVYFASAAPAVRHPNVYGIDMPAAQELIAHNRTTEEIRALIGADWLVYLDLEDLHAAAREGNPNIVDFEDSVFSGRYITGGVDEDYLKELESSRADDAKMVTTSPSP